MQYPFVVSVRRNDPYKCKVIAPLVARGANITMGPQLTSLEGRGRISECTEWVPSRSCSPVPETGLQSLNESRSDGGNSGANCFPGRQQSRAQADLFARSPKWQPPHFQQQRILDAVDPLAMSNPSACVSNISSWNVSDTHEHRYHSPLWRNMSDDEFTCFQDSKCRSEQKNRQQKFHTYPQSNNTAIQSEPIFCWMRNGVQQELGIYSQMHPNPQQQQLGHNEDRRENYERVQLCNDQLGNGLLNNEIKDMTGNYRAGGFWRGYARKTPQIAKCRFCKGKRSALISFQEHLKTCPNRPKVTDRVCTFCGENVPDDVPWKEHNAVCKM